MRILLMLAMALLTACQSLPSLPEWQSPEGREHPELGVILDLRSGERLSPEQLVGQLASADRVLIGERHDNPDHHTLQLWLVQALAMQRRQGSLLLEMLVPAQQAKVDGVREMQAQGRLPSDLPAALEWEKGWPWGLYGDVVSYALQQPYPVLAANLDRSEVMFIFTGAAPPLSGDRSTASPVREVLLAQVRRSHCDLLPEAQLPAMVAVQQQRDRRMADRLLAAPQPALLLAGSFHVRRDLGVPLHLDDLDAQGATRVLILAEVGERLTAQQADYVWYTPAQPEQDHCAQMRQTSR